MSSPAHLSGRLGTHITVAPVEEVAVVRERETVSRVMTVPAKLNAAIASLTTATEEKDCSEYVKALRTKRSRRRHRELISQKIQFS